MLVIRIKIEPLSQSCHYIDPYNKNVKHEHLKTKDRNFDVLHINIQSLIVKRMN